MRRRKVYSGANGVNEEEELKANAVDEEEEEGGGGGVESERSERGGPLARAQFVCILASLLPRREPARGLEYGTDHR